MAAKMKLQSTAILTLLLMTISFTSGRDETYNIYFLNEFCTEYYDEAYQTFMPLPISIKHPERPPPLSTALITWTKSHRHTAFQRNCSLDITRTKYQTEFGEFRLRITGGVESTKDTGSCKDYVEVSVGTFNDTKPIFNSCKSLVDFSYITARNEIIRIRSQSSKDSLGIPFTFVVTAVREQNNTNSKGGCGDLFACQNGLCLNPGVKCDGRDNCGDFSDEGQELNCPPIEHDDDDHDEGANWMLLGIVLGGFVIVFLTIAAAIIFIAGHYNKKAKEKVMKEAQTETEYPEKGATIPLTERFENETGVKTQQFEYSEPANAEVEAENPLYESADSSLSSNKEEK